MMRWMIDGPLHNMKAFVLLNAREMGGSLLRPTKRKERESKEKTYTRKAKNSMFDVNKIDRVCFSERHFEF